MLKFLIVGENSINKIPLIKMLLKNEGLFTVAKYFTTVNDLDDEFYYYISNSDLNICHKNNAILFVKTDVSESYGVTIDDFDESNVIYMNTEDFNNISNKIFHTYKDLVVVWLDTKNHDTRINNEIRETEYMLSKIDEESLKYLYFLDADLIEIMDVVCEYMQHEEKREEILEKYS